MVGELAGAGEDGGSGGRGRGWPPRALGFAGRGGAVAGDRDEGVGVGEESYCVFFTKKLCSRRRVRGTSRSCACML